LRFLPDPFTTAPGAQLYRTGDKVRYLADGAIQYLGRLDQQVKIRGYRVELGEIEAVLGKHPRVRAAAVVLEGARSGEPRLVAYLESQEPESLSAAELRAFLKERLPHYMVPSIFVGVTGLEMSSAGKIDRNRLPHPCPLNTLRDENRVPARNPLETRMTDVWKRVLKIDSLGIHDNFFDLGGHSLLLPVLLNEIRREFKRDIAMVTLLAKPTISACAALFGEIEADGDLVVERGKERASRVRDMTLRKWRTK
jgi:hypothetical protein